MEKNKTKRILAEAPEKKKEWTFREERLFLLVNVDALDHVQVSPPSGLEFHLVDNLIFGDHDPDFLATIAASFRQIPFLRMVLFVSRHDLDRIKDRAFVED